MRCEAYSVGTYFPELEWAHHLPFGHWRSLVDAHEKIIVVSGNNLPGWLPHAMNRKALCWIATPYWGDRKDRFQAWPTWRRAYDRIFNNWISGWQERRLLQSLDTWAIGDYALRELRSLTPVGRVHGTIIIPIDVELFHPRQRFLNARSANGFRVGFSGRVSDPRKNMKLLVDSFARLHRRFPDSELHIRGDMARDAFISAYGGGNLGNALRIDPPAARAQMPDFLRSLDCFALMSHQEGLSQIAMEAMACGACVVSTRCGGPEEFVINGVTGFLTEFDDENVCDTISSLVLDPDRRRRIAIAGAEHVRHNYAPARFRSQFTEAMSRTFS